ncbi:phosphosulfolactate synthase [Alicyclobacillus cycloheptanicus]|uniref:phosphosulfolactate synthase n=1 Tax=Alicyclobacillus cycloheptanicus TaxID=1457 RepID=UPI002378F516|nr:phosphosulfolactate synthase [Alicyclobacillus cycloheptanicus]WDM00410.1 phosphosulfolactate synthase [Alicyclobacillus cycloheptanicus]
MEEKFWSERLQDVLPGRAAKPRIGGLTMVIDKGLPIGVMRDIFELAAPHVDYWKFGFASASVCPPERVMDKIMLCQEYGVLAYPGGTSLEIAYVQGIWRDYLSALADAGVKVVEVSDGTVQIPLKTRREIIRTARKMGFTVFSEIGKKLPGVFLPVTEQAQIIHGDLNSGANYIIVEGREAGTSIGVYDADGNVKTEDVNALLDILGPLSSRLIWEAPLTKQQVFYVNHLGNKVNLGNIPPWDVVTLESIRRGFRSDTLRPTLGPVFAADAGSRAFAADERGESEGVAVKGAIRPHRSRFGRSADEGITLWTQARQGKAQGRGGSTRMADPGAPDGGRRSY